MKAPLHLLFLSPGTHAAQCRHCRQSAAYSRADKTTIVEPSVIVLGQQPPTILQLR